MRPINASELLNVWERGGNHALPQKALLLLDTAASDGDLEDSGLLSIGDRDARLLQLREWMFGKELLSVSNCPQCGERIEWINNTADLRVSLPEKNSSGHFSFQIDEYNIQYRLPNSYDISVAERIDPKKILADCIIEVRKDENPWCADDLPDEVFSKLDEQMEKKDPQADIRMRLQCPACAHVWESPFDIVSYLWTEIDSWARHILQEIAILAAIFGWSETQILELPPRRRQLYLEIVRR